jgi:hypothetical protein
MKNILITLIQTDKFKTIFLKIENLNKVVSKEIVSTRNSFKNSKNYK